MCPHEKPSGMPGWLAMCIGLVCSADQRPRSFPENPHPVVTAPKPQLPKKPTTDWKIIPLVGEYNLLKKIGKGGFSDIWLSEHKLTKELVAIKVVQLTFADLEPEEVATLRAEATFLRTLDCPYLVKCTATAHTEDWLVLVLEYCSGGEVLEHLYKVMKYTEAEAAKLFAQIVSAVSYLHNLNLIHRDIKPENVLFVSPIEDFEAEGRPLRVKLIDLGMALLYNPNKEVLGCVGTPGFMAPEVWNGKPQTSSMDIYSLGVLLFIMLTGRKPQGGADIRRMGYCSRSIHDAPGLKDERFLSLSFIARELLLAMLADDPRDRPSCMEVLRHPFIAAVDSNAEAHREMGAAVRRRIRDLHRIRRLHGLSYAMHTMRPLGTNHRAFLEVLEQRRLRLKRESTQGRENCCSVDSEGSSFPRSSLCLSYEDGFSSGFDVPPPVTPTPGINTCSAATSHNKSNKGGKASIGRPSADGEGSSSCDTGAKGSTPAAALDKLALLRALPVMKHCIAMPPRRYATVLPPDLSPVASCDLSAFGNFEEAAVPRNWSAYPIMYEALGARDQILRGDTSPRLEFTSAGREGAGSSAQRAVVAPAETRV